MHTTPSSWELINDPVEVAIRKLWLSEALSEHVNGVDLSDDVDALEFLGHYADKVVTESVMLCRRYGLLSSAGAQASQVAPNAGWRLHDRDIATIWPDKNFSVLVSHFAPWETKAGEAGLKEFQSHPAPVKPLRP